MWLVGLKSCFNSDLNQTVKDMKNLIDDESFV